MKTRHILTVAAVVLGVGFAVHRGFTQAPPTVVGPGYAPNVGTPVNPYSLAYYGGYYGGPESFYNYASNVYNVTFGPEDIPQTSDKITTKMSGNSVSFHWQGEPRAIRSITFALLDKNNAVVTSKTITTQPVTTTLKKTVRTTGYSVNVEYINGLTNSIVSPL